MASPPQSAEVTPSDWKSSENMAKWYDLIDPEVDEDKHHDWPEGQQKQWLEHHAREGDSVATYKEVNRTMGKVAKKDECHRDAPVPSERRGHRRCAYG